MHMAQHKLPNGIPLYTLDVPSSKLCSVQIWFKAGSALEEKDNLGMAHFLEHMFFKGTPTRPKANIAKEVESFGADINAFTSFNYTCYYINTPQKHVTKAYEILLDMISNPMFLNEDIVPEREVVFEEYRRSIDSPSQYHFLQLQKNSFTKKGYNHPILGQEKTIKNFSQKQLRDFRKKNYNKNNCFIVIAGNIEKKISEFSLKARSFKMPQGPKTLFPPFKLLHEGSSSFHTKETAMCQLTLSFEALKLTDKKMAAQDLAINALALGDSSPLYRKLVLEGTHASDVSGSTLYFTNGGVHLMKIVFPIENYEKVKENFLTLINDLITHGPNYEDVKKIKNQYLASKIYEKESLESLAFSLGHSLALTDNPHLSVKFIRPSLKSFLPSFILNFKFLKRKRIFFPLIKSLQNLLNPLKKLKQKSKNGIASAIMSKK